MLSVCTCYSNLRVFPIFNLSFCSLLVIFCLTELNRVLICYRWWLASTSRLARWFLIIWTWFSSSIFLLFDFSFIWLNCSTCLSYPMSIDMISWLRCFWVKMHSMQRTSLHSWQNTSTFLDEWVSHWLPADRLKMLEARVLWDWYCSFGSSLKKISSDKSWLSRGSRSSTKSLSWIWQSSDYWCFKDPSWSKAWLIGKLATFTCLFWALTRSNIWMLQVGHRLITSST
jgi:hypothetical protein